MENGPWNILELLAEGHHPDGEGQRQHGAQSVSRGIWNTLELLADGHQSAAVLAEWRQLTGADFASLKSFLRPTQRLAENYPCLGDPDCGCRHEIDTTELFSLCQCGIGGCEPVKLAPADLIIHELDAVRFGDMVARSLGFGGTENGHAAYAASKIWPAGTCTATRSPVLLAICPNESQLLDNLQVYASARTEPFILLAPTASLRSEAVNALLQRQRCAFIPLGQHLAADGKKFRVTNSIRPILDRFAARLAEGSGLARTVEKIGRDIEAVARNQYELRKENDELRQLNKNGYFNFAVRVKGEDFLAFAVIMALGNRKAAADHLEIPHRTFYNRVGQWAKRGKEYQLMLRYMEWRKRSSRHLTVELNPSLQSGDSAGQPENPETMAGVLAEIEAADSKSYPALFAEVLQALERQNSGNWMNVRQELVDMIKEDVLQ
jgi:hypothetical protein